MKYKIYSHRFAEQLANHDEDFSDEYNEIKNVINGISDEDLKERFRKEKAQFHIINLKKLCFLVKIQQV